MSKNNVMKIIQTILYLTYNILLFLIAISLFLSIAVIAEINSWYYLLLYVPIILSVYESEATDFKKKKYADLKRKNLRS